MEENQDGAASRDLRLEADNVSVSAFLDFRRKVIEEDQEVDAVSLEQLDRMAIGPQHSYALTQGKGPVAVSELPCPDYEVFAHLPFGDWNEVPKDAELIAVLRHWGAKYGASLFAIGADWIELYLEKPISEPEVASDFATELFLVCPDCVYQGVQSMQALAQTILNARFLFLWWD